MFNILIPTRNRPTWFLRLLESLKGNSSFKNKLYIGLQEDDASIPEYREIIKKFDFDFHVYEFKDIGLTAKVNALAAHAFNGDPAKAIPFMFLADDIVIKTKGFDEKFYEKIETNKIKILYGKDGFQNERLPTHPILTTSAYWALGWFFYPKLRHLFVDNVLKFLGERANCLEFIGEIEYDHLHPAAKKADFKTYSDTNSRKSYLMHQAIFEKFIKYEAENYIQMLKNNNV